MEIDGERRVRDMETVKVNNSVWDQENSCFAATPYIGPGNQGDLRNPGSVHAFIVSWEKDRRDASDSHGVRLGTVLRVVPV